jgi:hypothetical protein
MASIPLAIVLIAALLVPLAVIPGTFGFHDWPSTARERVGEHPVREQPRTIQVVKDTPATAGAPRKHARDTSEQRSASAEPGLVASVPGRANTPVATPDASGPSSNGTAGGPGESGTPSSPAVPTPSTPAAEPEQPGTEPNQPGTDQVAGDDTPVLRDDAPAAPATPSTPIAPVAPAPAAPVAPSVPLLDDQDSDGDGASGTVGDLVRGLGLGRGHRLGFGHGRD